MKHPPLFYYLQNLVFTAKQKLLSIYFPTYDGLVVCYVMVITLKYYLQTQVLLYRVTL